MNISKSNQNRNNMTTKNVNKTLAFIAIITLFSNLTGYAQKAPELPTPSQPTSVSSSKRETSVSINEDQNSSISVSISDDSYKFRARFDHSKNEGIKEILLNQLREKSLKINGNTYLWTNKQGNDNVFECKFNKGQLKIYMDKVVASEGFQKKIVALGEDLKSYISGTTREKETLNKSGEAKRKLLLAKRELELAKRKLDHAEREAKRAKED